MVWLCQAGVYPAILAMLEGFEQNHSVNVQWASGGATVTLHHSGNQQCHQHDLMERFVMLWADDTPEKDHIVKTVGANLDLRDGERLAPRADVPIVLSSWERTQPTQVKASPEGFSVVINRHDAKRCGTERLRTVQLLI
ncbi:MAG: hypothetical protein KDK97_02425 [Verrucomicrobiales bacterium]|nr:hypothetical protein [Verrucomicrobiales bacterium]MCP5556897.1 hypothetical protein [Verrucomicrobiaceae bacterium]